MMQLVQKLQQKPKDSTIRLIRIIFALLIALVVVLGWDTFTLAFGLPEMAKFALLAFALVGLVRGIFDPGVFRRRIWRWVLVGLGATMVLLALIVIDEKDISETVAPVVSGSGGISLTEIENNSSAVSPMTTDYTTLLDTDTWFQLLGWILLFTGLIFNSKNITTKNERYGEVIKKIRV